MNDTNIVKRDWLSTENGAYFNDQAVMFLFELIARTQNRVNSWVFRYLYGDYDIEEFKVRFNPSRLEKDPWITGRTTTSLDEGWMVLPINIENLGKHWVCVLRTAVFTSPGTQKINLFYVDSIKGNYYEEYVKGFLSGTPLFPSDTENFQCEWIRLEVEQQSEVECGARACLHAHILAAMVQDNEMTLEFMTSLKECLQEILSESQTIEALMNARVWARQSIALKRLVAFSEIDMVYEDMDWKRVLQSRRKEKERIRKRNQRVKSLSPLTTPLASCENIKLSPEEVLAGIRSKNRAYKRKSRAQRKKSASSEELEKLRIKSRIQEAVSKTKRKAASSPEELEAMRLENRKKEAKSKAKRKALLLPEELEAMRKRHQVSVALGRDRRKREEMTQDPILPTIKTSLEMIINGEKPLMTLDELPETKKLQKDFLKKCESKQMEFCRTCKKRWWDLKIDGSGICKNCRVDLANPKVRISKLSNENKMDPFPNGYPTHLPELNSIEQAMISRISG